MNTQEIFDRIIASTIEDFGQDKVLKINRKIFEEMPQPMFGVNIEEEFIIIKLLN